MVETAGTIFLNLPRNHLLSLPSVVSSLEARTKAMAECVVFDQPESIFGPGMSTEPTSALTKAYFYYPDAWWVTKLNRTAGEFPDNAFFPGSWLTTRKKIIHKNI